MPLTDPVEEIVHGATIRDPYRWLEDRNLPETEEWIRIEQRRCDRYFASCPDLAAAESRVREYLDVEVVDQPACFRDHYFYRRRSIAQEQGSICIREILSGEERILVDPSPEGRYTSAGIHRISADGALLAYEVKCGGEDRKEIRFVDASDGTLLPNSIPLGYGRGLAFSSNGYFYCQETDPRINEHRIHYQSFGSAGQGRDVFRVPLTRGSRLILTANAHWLGALWLHPEGPEVLRDFWIADLVDGTPDWIEVFRNKDAPYTPILCHDRILALAETESNTSQLVELSRSGEEIGVVVPAKETPIEQITVTQDRIFLSYLGNTTIDAWLLSGQRTDSINLPKGGTVRILPAHTQDMDRFFYTFESLDAPPAIYLHHVPTNRSALWHQRGPSNRKMRSRVQETTIRSKDGAQIPLTLVSAERDEAPTATRPVIMTSYGGFGVAMTPQFSALAAIMLELGVTFALPHIRGGGEFGKAWHDRGRARKRQTSFDDFIAAAEWLCNQGITTPCRLAIFGGSNSGLLVATVMTQRPELFGAVLCIAPLLDMVRYESFDQAVKWRREYGTVEDPDDFHALHAYSPYHHVAEEVDYPATLFVTGDKDDRCNPAHVRKMAALLQGRSAQRAPVIVDYATERGHSPVLPLSDRISALARRIAFLCREIEISLAAGGPDEAPRP